MIGISGCRAADEIDNLERSFLRQVVILDDRYLDGDFPNTIRPSFLLQSLAIGEPAVENCVYVKQGAIMNPPNIARSIADLEEDVTFFEVFTKDFEKFRLPRNFTGVPIAEKTLNEGCILVISSRENELVVVQYKAPFIQDSKAYECAIRSHLFYFGLPLDSQGENSFEEYLLTDHHFYSDSEPWGVSFDFEAIRTRVENSTICGGKR